MAPENVTVHLSASGHIREFLPAGFGRVRVDLAPGSTVADALTQAGVNPELVMAVVINGRRRPKDARLSDGDEVILMGPPSGG